MRFIRSFVDRRPEPEQAPGGWDFSQDEKPVYQFTLGGLILIHNPKSSEYVISTENSKAVDPSTLT